MGHSDLVHITVCFFYDDYFLIWLRQIVFSPRRHDETTLGSAKHDALRRVHKRAARKTSFRRDVVVKKNKQRSCAGCACSNVS